MTAVLTFATLKGSHIALACRSVSVKSSFYLLASIPRKDIEIFRGAQGEDNCFHDRYYRSMRAIVKR